MAPLSQASAQALARLRAYVPPPSTYSSLPLSRRAAVLILLFADRRGDLRVVLTMRANPGQAALPGGKADTLSETPFQTARREAYEEIGLPNDDKKLPPPFRVEHLCQLPTNLARTELGVRPCVAYLHSGGDDEKSEVSAEESLIPRLDAKEVAAVFTAPFHNFLLAKDELRESEEKTLPGNRADWYEGAWTDWHQSRWRMHNFFVPVVGQTVTKPKSSKSDQRAAADRLEQAEKAGNLERYRVFGMTARILVDAARVAYDQEPDFEHNSHFGDEDMIERLKRMGRLSAIRRPGDELKREDLEKAAKM
ncbi:hypothetical protein MMC16_000447 [Acarospora aff. strigata]|nr:hypothetical protein [Acarospora aff. strigata]